MKKKLIIFCIILFLSGGIAGSGIKIKAAGDYTNVNLNITMVDDIDVYNDYNLNNIPIDNTLTNNQDGGQIYKVTLDQDGFIKMLISARKVRKTVKGIISDASVAVMVYRDDKCLYPVTPKISSTGLIKGETAQKIALDKGTYYIGFLTDKCISGDGKMITTVQGNAEFILYYQKVNSSETYRPSNVGKENQLTFDNEFVGILTTTNPKDYYKFELTEKALIKLNLLYGSSKNAKFILYSKEREALVTKSFAGNSVWYNFEKYLDPGIYYCSLEIVTANDGGQYNLLLTKTDYPLKLTQKNETVNSYVDVSTIDDPKEIRSVKGNLTNSELTSSKWLAGKIITKELRFGVNETGFYTVRVTDEYGNMFMQSIKVTACDKIAPGKPTITRYKAGTLIISGKAEKNSTVTITINGRVYTCTSSSKGNYKYDMIGALRSRDKIEVYATDISGNNSTKAIAIVK